MINSTCKKTAVAMAVAGLFGATGPVQAEVVNFSWSGALTVLNSAGSPIANALSDYAAGYYGNGSHSLSSFGAPYFPGNVGPGAIPSSS